MADNRRGGTIEVAVDGNVYDAKGAFTYNLGRPKREGIVGSDRVHGYKETPQLAFLEGIITDRGTLNLDDLLNLEDATVTLKLINGKTIAFREAWYAADGDVTTEEGEVQVRFEAVSAEEIAS